MIRYSVEKREFGFLTKSEKYFVEQRLININIHEMMSGKLVLVVKWITGNNKIKTETKEITSNKPKIRVNIFDIEIRISKKIRNLIKRNTLKNQ